jgi:hypothetical protein
VLDVAVEGPSEPEGNLWLSGGKLRRISKLLAPFRDPSTNYADIYCRYQYSGKNQMKLLENLIETSAYICHETEQQDCANSGSRIFGVEMRRGSYPRCCK